MHRLLAIASLIVAGWPLAASAQGPAPKYHSGQGTVTCESNRGGYRECHTGYRAPPRVIQRLSDSACVEGRSWGHRPGMVWVSQGCRAVFEESRGWGGWTGGGGQGGGRDIVCESRRNRYTECRADFRGQVDLVEQLSREPCVEGRTWGQSRNGVWVDSGCRGRFAEFYQGGGGHWGGGSGYTMECESRGNRHQRCAWDWGRGTPFLLRQLSHTACVRNHTWGYDTRRQELWVTGGCRAVFGSR